MKIIIFGPTGATGQAAIRHAISRGWEVTAYARTPSKLQLPQGKCVSVIQGDALDSDHVTSAIAGHDAVFVSLGPGLRFLYSRGDTVCSEGTKNIVDAMKKTGVKRVVVISSMGAGSSRRFINAFHGWVLKYALEDKSAQEKVVKESELDFVIVRPTGLTNGPIHGHLAIVDSDVQGLPHNQVSRNDLAIFALDQLENDTWLGKCPGISFDHRGTLED